MAKNMGQITKTERRAIIKRVTAFRDEFAAKPEHSIRLDFWHREVDAFDIAQNPDVAHCGSVGCIGGYACRSPFMADYLKKHNLVIRGNYYDTISGKDLNGFFGITADQSEKWDLFAPKRTRKSNRSEGLARLNRVIAFHKKQLEA